MVYTIGHTKSYEAYFEEQGTPQKMGRNGEYPGGSVWRSIEDAKMYCTPAYSVYGVEADWDRDTVPSQSGSWHDLLIDAVLVKLT